MTASQKQRSTATMKISFDSSTHKVDLKNSVDYEFKKEVSNLPAFMSWEIVVD